MNNQLNIDLYNKKNFSFPIEILTKVLKKIENIETIKFLIFTLYRFQAENLKIQFFTKSQIESSNSLSEILADIKKLDIILKELVELGVFISIETNYKNKKEQLYFLNNARNRAAIRAIETGEWLPKSNVEEITFVNRPNIYQLYEDNIGALTPIIAELLDEAEKEYSYPWIEEAFKLAVKKDARNWAYVEAILKRWKKDKSTTWIGEKNDSEEEDPFAHIYK
jgi:DnaD/phage-associated family protein